jgi:hypothetical protein
MQSKRSLTLALVVASAASIACGLLAWVAGEGNAALLLGALAGFTLGFVFPRGAWRWALVLGLWVPILLALRVKLVPSAAFSWCPEPTAMPPSVIAWTLALVPVAAVCAGVIADWFAAGAIRWAGSLGWPSPEGTRMGVRIAVLCAAVVILMATALMLAQPLRPYAVGQNYCWDEYCFAIISVKRVKSLGEGADRATARGVFYVVTADMATPWWGRFTWSNDAVYAIDYSGAEYDYSRPGQRALDEQMKSTRSRCHQILGAGETETIVFDLPQGVVQPRLLVRDTLGFEGLLSGIRLNLFYVKPAFNLRYD